MVIFADSVHTSLAPGALRLVIYAGSVHTILASDALRLVIYADIVHTILASRALGLTRAAAGHVLVAGVGDQIARLALATLGVRGATVRHSLHTGVRHQIADVALAGTLVVPAAATRNGNVRARVVRKTVIHRALITVVAIGVQSLSENQVSFTWE